MTNKNRKTIFILVACSAMMLASCGYAATGASKQASEPAAPESQAANGPVLRMDKAVESEDFDGEAASNRSGSLKAKAESGGVAIGEKSSSYNITGATLVYGLTADANGSTVDLALRAPGADGVLVWWGECKDGVYAPTAPSVAKTAVTKGGATTVSYRIETTYADGADSGYISLDRLNDAHKSISATYSDYFVLDDWMHAYRYTDYVYARPYKISESEDGSYTVTYAKGVTKYSVLDYCYNMYSSSSETVQGYIDDIKANGAKAQKAKYGDNAERLSSAEYYKVKLSGGKLSDGFTQGLYSKDETVSLKDSSSLFVSSRGNAYVGSFALSDSLIGEASSSKTIALTSNESLSKLTFNLVDGDHYEIGRCQSAITGDIAIPGYYNGLPVTAIQEYAFYCNGFNYNLVSVTIPDTVTSIGSYAFYDCRGINTLKLSSSLTTIGDRAFLNCSALASLELPSSLTTIGMSAFKSCSALAELELPSSLTTIGASAFESCSALAELELPSSLTTIGAKAFYGCSKLKSVFIPSEITAIGSNVFNYDITKCVSFASESNKPEGWNSNWHAEGTNIKYVKYGCEYDGGFVYKKLTNDTASIASYIFSDPDIDIPDKIKGMDVVSIEEKAFYSDDRIAKVTIPDSVTEIGDYNFLSCKNLQIDTDKYGVKYVGNKKNPYLYLLDGSGLTNGNYSIPGTTKCIGTKAFYNNATLSCIIIPSSVTSIGSLAFSGIQDLSVNYSGTLENWEKINFNSDNWYLVSGALSLEKPEGVDSDDIYDTTSHSTPGITDDSHLIVKGYYSLSVVCDNGTEIYYSATFVEIENFVFNVEEELNGVDYYSYNEEEYSVVLVACNEGYIYSEDDGLDLNELDFSKVYESDDKLKGGTTYALFVVASDSLDYSYNGEQYDYSQWSYSEEIVAIFDDDGNAVDYYDEYHPVVFGEIDGSISISVYWLDYLYDNFRDLIPEEWQELL